MSSPLQILQQYWKHAAFRPLQEEIIQSVLQGKDCIALLPTGGGKSVCYQIPGIITRGEFGHQPIDCINERPG